MSVRLIEDSYCLKDAEHTPGTNLYQFKWNQQWRTKIHEHLTVSVRSIKLWLAPRHLWIDNLNVYYGSKQQTIATGFDVMLLGSMSEFNKQLAGKIDGYRIYYNPTNRRLVFACDSNNYFDLSNTVMSPDFQVITGSENFSNITVLAEVENHITAFCFENIWNRENVHVRASFVDLGYQNFLGVSNEQFVPPKDYPISFTDSTFWIRLFDSIETPVEIPPLDNKDTLMIEMILNSYT